MDDLFVTQAIVASAGTQLATSGTVIFSNSNQVSFGLAGSKTLTADFEMNISMAGNTTGVTSSNVKNFSIEGDGAVTVGWEAPGLIHISAPAIGTAVKAVASVGSTGTIKRYAPEDHQHAGLNSVSIAGNTAGATTAGAGSVVFAGGANITLSCTTAAGGMTISVAAGNYLTTAMASNRGSDFVQATATIAGTSISGTIASNGMSLSVGPYITTGMASNRGSDFVQATATIAGTNVSGTIASNGISLSAGPTDVQGISTYGNTSGTTGLVSQQMVFVGSNGIGLSQSVNGQSATLSIQQQPLSRWNPFVNAASIAPTSNGPASAVFFPLVLPVPVAMSQINMIGSWNAVAPGATSQASTGTAAVSYSHGLSIFTRNGYGANSSQMSFLTSASFGFSAGISYSSTSQSFVMSWLTDSTGGTSSYNTTSNGNGWTSHAAAGVIYGIPFVTTLPAGEYFFGFQHSTTTGTTQSNITLVSFSMQLVSHRIAGVHRLGTASFSYYDREGVGCGLASAVTTNNTMAISVITTAIIGGVYDFHMINATGF